MFFFSVRQSNKSEVRRIQNRLQFDNSACVEAKGKAGDLAIFWIKEVEVELLGMEDHFTDVQLHEESGRSWRLSGIYGWSESG